MNIFHEYFVLKLNSNEVGSSTMPHKVNPINFENAEVIYCWEIPYLTLCLTNYQNLDYKEI